MNQYPVIHTKLHEIPLQGKRVLLRVDYNISFADPIDDYRISATLPTIDYLLKQGAHIILMTHIGRPTYPDASLSTQRLVPWFVERGYHIQFASDIQEARFFIQQNHHTIIMLENLRFFPQEMSQDPTFAAELALLADIYINDAFGSMHRAETSISILPFLFDFNCRSIGFLVEKELVTLSHLMTNPTRPFCLILGGGKIKDKIPLIESMLETIDALFLCPAIVFSFLYALRRPVGSSYVDTTVTDTCLRILEEVKKQRIALYLPIDLTVMMQDHSDILSHCSTINIASNQIGISIGATTLAQWEPYIKQAGTIFYNGLMGFMHHKETLDSTIKLFQMIGESSGMSIIAGGDSGAAVEWAGLTHAIDFLSTGGGASLHYISNRSLIGLKPFSKNWTESQ